MSEKGHHILTENILSYLDVLGDPVLLESLLQQLVVANELIAVDGVPVDFVHLD
jgi:hypothetical protein